MSTIPFVGEGGPAATISKIGGPAKTGVIQPPQSSINFGNVSPGAADATRRLFLLIAGAGASQCTGMSWNGTPCDFFDVFGNVAIGSIADASSVSPGTFNMQFAPTFAQNFAVWGLRATNLKRPLNPLDFNNGSFTGSNGTWSIPIRARRGGIVVGGLGGSMATTGVINTSLANSETQNDVTNRFNGSWEASATTQNQSVTMTQTSPTSGTLFGAFWSFR